MLYMFVYYYHFNTYDLVTKQYSLPAKTWWYFVDGNAAWGL